MKLISLAPLLLLLAACGGGVDLSTPDKTAAAYLNAKIARDTEAAVATLSRQSPPSLDLAEGVDFPAGEASGYASFSIFAQTADRVSAEVTFKDGTKAKREFFLVREGDEYRITGYVWIP
jgi:hypothetical protein